MLSGRKLVGDPNSSSDSWFLPDHVQISAYTILS